jgi:hypothetical protein
MAAEEIDYRQVGRDFYAAIRRVRELLHLYESQQWPPAMPEKFDKGLSAMVADPEWRQGTALPTDAQKECAAMLEAAGMLSFAAHRVLHEAR